VGKGGLSGGAGDGEVVQIVDEGEFEAIDPRLEVYDAIGISFATMVRTQEAERIGAFATR
jgi:hypothetical protein